MPAREADSYVVERNRVRVGGGIGGRLGRCSCAWQRCGWSVRRSNGTLGTSLANAAAAGGASVAAAVFCISMSVELDTVKRCDSLDRTVGSSRCWLTRSLLDRSGASFQTQQAAMIMRRIAAMIMRRIAAMIMRRIAAQLTVTTNMSMPSKLLRRFELNRMSAR